MFMPFSFFLLLSSFLCVYIKCVANIAVLFHCSVTFYRITTTKWETIMDRKLYGDNNLVVGNCSAAISFKGFRLSLLFGSNFAHLLHLFHALPLIRINFREKSNCIQSDCHFYWCSFNFMRLLFAILCGSDCVVYIYLVFNPVSNNLGNNCFVIFGALLVKHGKYM